MKSFISIFLLAAFAISAQGKTPQDISLKCVTETPTTSFLARTEGNKVIVDMINSFGVDYMPIHDGVIVGHDLPYLSSVAKVLHKLGDHVEFTFSLDKCTVYGDGQLSCFGSDTKNFDGTNITGDSFWTTVVTETTFGETFHSLKVSLGVNIEGFVPAQDISMYFYGKDCRRNF